MSINNSEMYEDVRCIVERIMHRKRIEYSFGEIDLNEYTKCKDVLCEILDEIYDESEDERCQI